MHSNTIPWSCGGGIFFSGSGLPSDVTSTSWHCGRYWYAQNNSGYVNSTLIPNLAEMPSVLKLVLGHKSHDLVVGIGVEDFYCSRKRCWSSFSVRMSPLAHTNLTESMQWLYLSACQRMDYFVIRKKSLHILIDYSILCGLAHFCVVIALLQPDPCQQIYNYGHMELIST